MKSKGPAPHCAPPPPRSAPPAPAARARKQQRPPRCPHRPHRHRAAPHRPFSRGWTAGAPTTSELLQLPRSQRPVRREPATLLPGSRCCEAESPKLILAVRPPPTIFSSFILFSATGAAQFCTVGDNGRPGISQAPVPRHASRIGGGESTSEPNDKACVEPGQLEHLTYGSSTTVDRS